MATEIIKKIRDVLVAFEIHQKGLEALCFGAFCDVPEIQSSLDFSGAPITYITNLIRVLSDYGQLASGEHALVRLLKEVQKYWGIDKQKYIAALIKEFEEYRQQHPDYGKEKPGLMHEEAIPGMQQHIQTKDFTGNIVSQGNHNFNWQININPPTHLDFTSFTPKQPVPSCLLADRPRKVPHFRGREAELETILQKLRPGSVVTLCGTAGIGKTALATEVVWRLFPDDNPSALFPNGIIWHNFYSAPQTDKVWQNIIEKFGEEPRPSPIEAAKRALAGRKLLLVLDGAEKAEKSWKKVLEVTGNCGVLVTSWKHTDAEYDPQKIRLLPLEQAEQLLQDWGQQYAADTMAVKRICELVGNLPLAIRLVGRYLNATETIAAEYLEWLEEEDERLKALDQRGLGLESVPLLIERSLEQVSENARQVLKVAGAMALAPFSRETVAVALAEEREIEKQEFETTETSKVREALGELVNYGLLVRPDERYEISHALIHHYAKKRMPVDGETVERLAYYYAAVYQTIEENDLGATGYQYLDPERPHILQVMKNCKDRQNWQAVSVLVWTISSYLDMQGHWTDRKTALKMGLEAVRNLGEHDSEEKFLNSLGVTYNYLGQLEQAINYYKRALTIARKIGDRQGEGRFLANLGTTYSDLGQVGQTVEYYKQALTIHQEVDDRRSEGNLLENLGIIYHEQGQVEHAIAYYKQALAIAREISRRSEGSVLSNLGNAYHALGQVEKAVECYKQALTIACETGDRRMEGNVLGNLGTIYNTLGQVEHAIAYYEQALTIACDIGDRQGEEKILGNLGIAYQALWQVEQAIAYYEQALAIARDIGKYRSEGIWLGNLGNAYHALGQVEPAIESYKQALTIARDIGDRKGEGIWLGNLGFALSTQGKLEEAIAVYQKQVEVKPDDEVAWLHLGKALFQHDELEEAIKAFQKQVEVKPDHEDARDYLGLALEQQGKIEEAIAAYQRQAEVTPKHEWAWFYLGMCFVDKRGLRRRLRLTRNKWRSGRIMRLPGTPWDLYGENRANWRRLLRPIGDKWRSSQNMKMPGTIWGWHWRIKTWWRRPLQPIGSRWK